MSELVNILNQTLAKPFDYDFKDDLVENENTNIPAAIIGDINNSNSLLAMRRLKQSIADTKSTLGVFILDAITPKTLDQHLEYMGYSIKDWNYPAEGQVATFNYPSSIGGTMTLRLTGYRTNDVKKVIACMASHMTLWHLCTRMKEPIMILEHDAYFTRKFDWQEFKDKHRENLKGSSVIALNNPLGATRKANLYYEKVIESSGAKETIVNVPIIDGLEIPQGLPGNSAYIIYPNAARHLLKTVFLCGMWPNDALMCQQIIPGLKISYPFYTQVQGVRSTTTK